MAQFIPPDLRPKHVKIDTNIHAIVWMGRTVAFYPDRGRALVSVRKWNLWLRRLQLADVIDSTAFSESVADFWNDASDPTKGCVPVFTVA